MSANLLGTLDAGTGEAGGSDNAQPNTDTISAGTAAVDTANITTGGIDSSQRSGGDVQHPGNGAHNEGSSAGGVGASDTGSVRQDVSRQDVVPQSALHEARAQVKALKAQIAQLESLPRLTAEDAALLRDLREQRAAASAKAVEPPDFLSDPKGYVDAQVAAAREQAEAAKKEGEAAKRATEEQRTRQEALASTAAAEAQFMQTAPDYPQALDHIRSIHRQQLALAHPDATTEQIAAHMAYVEMQTAMSMLAQGRNPAQYAYQVAQTWGYKPPARGNGQVVQATAAQRVDKDAARSLGSGGADGGSDDGGDGVDGMQEFSAARSERFGRRK